MWSWWAPAYPSAGRDGALTQGTAAPPLPTHGAIDVKPALGPRTSAIEQRTAIIAGERYYEVFEEGDGDDAKKVLARGALSGPLERLPLPIKGECEDYVLGAAETALVVACGRRVGATVEVQVHRSKNGGDSFTHAATYKTSTPSLAHVAVSPQGAALFTGMCLESKEDCSDPGAPILLLAGTNQSKQTRASEVVTEAQAPAFSADGSRAYYLAKRGKDGNLALMLTRDGLSFDARPLTPPKGARRGWGTGKSNRSLHPGDHGEVGMVLDDRSNVYALTDDDGRIVSIAKHPSSTRAIGGSGRHVMAIAEKRQRGAPTTVEVWTSADGGRSFRILPTPMTLQRDELDRHIGVACGSAGCVIGDRLTRLGWTDDDAIAPPPSEPAGPPRPNIKTPITCTQDLTPSKIDHVGWRTVRGRWCC